MARLREALLEPLGQHRHRGNGVLGFPGSPSERDLLGRGPVLGPNVTTARRELTHDADAVTLVVCVELDDSSMNRHGRAGRFGHGSLLSAFVVSVQAAPSIAAGTTCGLRRNSDRLPSAAAAIRKPGGSMSDTVRYEVGDHVAVVTLHRPERLNAMTTELL